MLALPPHWTNHEGIQGAHLTTDTHSVIWGALTCTLRNNKGADNEKQHGWQAHCVASLSNHYKRKSLALIRAKTFHERYNRGEPHFFEFDDKGSFEVR